MQQQRGIELDIGLQVAPRLVFFQQAHRDLLDVFRQMIELQVAVGGVHLLGGLRQHLGAGVAHFVNTMAEAHQTLALFEFGAQVRLGIGFGGDLEDHIERRAGRAAVQRPLQRTDRADHRRHHIRPG